jgi:hypothetical protein
LALIEDNIKNYFQEIAFERTDPWLVACSCEPSVSVEDGEFLDQMSDCRFSEVLCSMELFFSS